MVNKTKLLILCATIGLSSIGFFLWSFVNQKPVSSPEIISSLERLIEKIPTAVLLWSENGVVTGSSLKHWKPRPIVEGENPRWSPDGSRFVYTKNNDVWLMDGDLSDSKKVLRNVVTEKGTGAYWTNRGDGIVAIRKNKARQVIKLDFTSGKIHLIHDEGRPPYKGYRLTQCAELRIANRYLLTFTRDSGHRSMVIDLKEKRYITNAFMRKGDCEPAWSPDGSFIVMTRRARVSMNRPLYVAKFDRRSGKLSPSTYLIGRGRCYNSSISNDSKYVVYVCSGNLFAWSVDDVLTDKQDGIQITHTGKSSGPNLHIFSGPPPQAFR